MSKAVYLGEDLSKYTSEGLTPEPDFSGNECVECGLDLTTGCECFANALLDLTTKLDDLMKLVARSDIVKKLNA